MVIVSNCGFDGYGFKSHYLPLFLNLLTLTSMITKLHLFLNAFKQQITDILLFFVIISISSFVYYITLIWKLKLSILKLKTKILELNNLIALLEKKALILDQKIKLEILSEVDNNRFIAGLIFIGIGITIAILFYLFNSGSNNPNNNFGSDDSFRSSFSSQKSESSSRNSISDTDSKSITGLDSSKNQNVIDSSTLPSSEDIVVQNQLIEPLNTSLMETFERIKISLLPTISNWSEFSSKKNIDFSNSTTFELGQSLKSWLVTLEECCSKLEMGNFSTENFQSLELTLSSMDETLPKFIKNIQEFLINSNLNTKTKLDPDLTVEFDFVFNTREIAVELLQKLIENEAALTQISPGNLVIPEWFAGVICFFSAINIIYSEQLVFLPSFVSGLLRRLKKANFNDENDLISKQSLIERLTSWREDLCFFLKSPTNYNSPGEFLCVIENDENELGIISDLLEELLKHHECLNIDPTNIILFV